MDQPKTLPASPRHLRRRKWLRSIDSTAFSPELAAQISVHLAGDESGSPSERRTALELESEAVVPAPSAPQRPTDNRQQTKLRIALALVVLACAAIPVLLIAVIALS